MSVLSNEFPLLKNSFSARYGSGISRMVRFVYWYFRQCPPVYLGLDRRCPLSQFRNRRRAEKILLSYGVKNFEGPTDGLPVDPGVGFGPPPRGLRL